MHFYLSCDFASLKVSSVNNESINLKLESDMGTDKGISRREALARIGMIVAGVATSSIGLSALSSCAEKSQKKRIILYFTATGNCLHVAR